MFDSSELTNELQALKGDVVHLLSTASDGIYDASKNRAEALADHIKAAKSTSRNLYRNGQSHHSPWHSRLASLSAS